MHAVFPNILDQVRASNNSVFEPDSYEALVTEALHGTDGLNGEGEIVSGDEFWRAGRLGAAVVYSSAAGKRRLAELIESKLPEPEL